MIADLTAGPFFGAALLLVAGGGAKLRRPAPAARALTAARIPGGTTSARAIGVAEVAAGTAAMLVPTVGTAALVALLDEGRTVPGEPPAVCGYLQQIAALGGMDFFCQAGGWRPAELQYVVEAVHRESETPVTALLEQTMHRDSTYRGWGINE